jgi:hypothetical protein
MAWGPSPGTSSGHQGEAWQTLAAGQRSAAAAAQGREGLFIRESSWNFIGRFSDSSAVRQGSEWASSNGGKSPVLIGHSRAATRSQPAELRQVYQAWPEVILKSELAGPERLGRLSKQLRTLEEDKAQEAKQITALALGTEGLCSTRGTDPC